MIGSDSAATAETPPMDHVEGSEEDLDAWRDDIALITPSGPRQWLALPIAYLVIGVGYSAVVLLIAHGRVSPLDWVLVGTAGIFVVWAIALAWIGRRADLFYDLEVSQRYVRLKVGGACCLGILATAAGIVSGAVGIVILGFAAVWFIRSQREVRKSAVHASEFRKSVAAIAQLSFLIEGIVAVATSVTCGLVGLFLIDDASRLASEYIGGGVVFFIIGAAMTVMGIQQGTRAKALPRRD